ncbi:PREDICTED: glycerophosphodiester phosphodiesterase GDPD1, chloroplastic [Tarenaya hassleriana]|uniref:glycerophosphodiester phosphodiesterase GDPD1, chloroplastic n=1 Tax=Tarenaya hassleriana TaxID=28532 RepID=UPI00053C8571|nr:PREDICTED: glycerophosphodiester phosphodiesterase GDPD1, chloroplastic [Tarenaya hassleriana]
MALKAVHVTDVPSLTKVPEKVTFSGGVETASFVVVGHRGHGMNLLPSPDPSFPTFLENSISSFNAAAKFPIHFVEFDVQVTSDGCPVIFHDNFICSEENGVVYEKRVTELSLEEFRSYGGQKEKERKGKPLMRKTKEGKIVKWSIDSDDDPLCTLQEAFQEVDPVLGFNIELKFDDNLVYSHDHLSRLLRPILQVVSDHAKDRPIIFSSFQPDAALLVRKLQTSYPVFFLTNGGTEIYKDERRNSLEEAIKLSEEGGFQGIVSEVKAIFRNPAAVTIIKQSNLSLLTYGKLNNVVESVYMQHLMGVDGVIVDHVHEISHAVSRMIHDHDHDHDHPSKLKPRFSDKELSFLLKLIPQLIQH